MRCCARGLMSGRTRGNCVPCAIDEVPNNAWRRCCTGLWGKSAISSMVFHAPQSGHLPTHLLCSPPHCWQIYFVRSFAIRDSTFNHWEVLFVDINQIWLKEIIWGAINSTPYIFILSLSFARSAIPSRREVCFG